jgi:ketosteroid isomerase-like protein
MHQWSMLLTIAALSGVALTPVAAAAQQPSDIDKVRAASAALYAALSSLDVAPMERFWAHEPYVRYIGPPSRAVAVGWEEVKKTIAAGNAGLSERRVTLTQSHVQVSGWLAWEVGVETTQRTLKTGEVLNTQNFVTNIYENKDGQWLMVSHHASRVPR